jgi:HTH-type transcriptional regulator, cell division transcriptional repressor
MESMAPDGQWPTRRSTEVGLSAGDQTLGARIAAARRDARLTQRALADLVGVRLWLIDQWESEARVPPADKLEAVAKATGKTKRWLETGLDQLPRDSSSVPQPMPQPADERSRERLAQDTALERAAITDVAAQERDVARGKALLQETERALQRALAEAEALRKELARIRAEGASAMNEDGQLESPQVDSARGEPAELEAMAQWLTQTVRAAAKREAEGIIAAAREEARRLLADTGSAHEPPRQEAKGDKHTDDSDRP